MAKYEYPFHDHFFVFYIFLGSILLVLNLQTMMVIRRSKCLWTLSAYRIIFFGSTADAVNCGAQVAVVAFTFRSPAIHPTLNSLLSALFQTSYAMEYPTIFVLAFNRFIAVVFPKKMDLIFDERKTMIILILCFLFGAFNGALCLSGEIRSMWNPSIPTFYYTNESSFTANFMRHMDFYFGEYVYITSFIIYLIIVVFLLRNRQLIRSLRVEIPLLLHSFQIFTFSGILLYIWFYPVSDSALYHHIVNSLIIFRFGATPISLLVTNRTYRSEFLICKKRQLAASATVVVKSLANTPIRSTRVSDRAC